MARRAPTVVVGPELAQNFRRARRLLPISVSLVRDSDIVDADAAAARPWNGEHSVLSVGRLETEKNPLLLADVLARLDGRAQAAGSAGGAAPASAWKLLICGEGPLEGELRERLRRLGVEDRSELLG
jgi:glycosyltransferase involved in cell wall biosynthesis